MAQLFNVGSETFIGITGDKEDHSDLNTDTETATPEFTTSVKLDSKIEESLGQISNETDSVDMSDSLTTSQSNDDKSEVVTNVSEPGPVTVDTKIHQGDNGTKQGAEVPGASPAGSHRQHGGHRGQAGHNTHRQIPFRHHLQLGNVIDNCNVISNWLELNV